MADIRVGHSCIWWLWPGIAIYQDDTVAVTKVTHHAVPVMTFGLQAFARRAGP